MLARGLGRKCLPGELNLEIVVEDLERDIGGDAYGRDEGRVDRGRIVVEMLAPGCRMLGQECVKAACGGEVRAAAKAGGLGRHHNGR